jgi:hypothetical protein
VTVVQESVEDRGSEHLIAEDGAPPRDGLVGREEQAAALERRKTSWKKRCALRRSNGK